MKLTINTTIRVNKLTIGCFLAYMYIFTAYIAQDLLISSRVNSLCLYVFLAFSAYVFIASGRISNVISTFTCWNILFFLVSGVTLLYTPDFKRVMGSFYFMIVALCLCLFLQMYIKTDLLFGRFAWCYALSGFGFVVLLYLTGNLEGDANNRLGEELMGNANVFASMMMEAAMYTIWILVYRVKNPFAKAFLLVMTVVDIYALVLSGGRKFFILPFIFLYLLLFFKTNKNGKRNVFLYTILFAVLLSVVWSLIMNVDFLYNAIGVRMEGLLKNLAGEKGDSSAEVREVIRQMAFERWKERPLLGHGFDSFKFLAEKTIGRYYYSHCNYAELLYNGGILYMLLFYWIYYKILRNAFTNKRCPVAYKAFAIALVLSQFVFDYGAVTYETGSTMVMLMMAYNASIFVNKEIETNEQTTNFDAVAEK